MVQKYTAQDVEYFLSRTALRDRKAFEKLYDATSAKLFSVCLRVLKNNAEAEEMLQDVFIRIWQKSDRYAVTGNSPMTWLITIARNMSIDKLRKKKAHHVDLDHAPEVKDNSLSPEMSMVLTSEMDQLSKCLDELEDDRSDAVKAAYLDGDSYKILAERYDVPLNTMRTWLRRALLKLRECLTS